MSGWVQLFEGGGYVVVDVDGNDDLVGMHMGRCVDGVDDGAVVQLEGFHQRDDGECGVHVQEHLLEEGHGKCAGGDGHEDDVWSRNGWGGNMQRCRHALTVGRW